MDRRLAHGRVAVGPEERLAHVVAVLRWVDWQLEADDCRHRCREVGQAQHLVLHAACVGSRVEALQDDPREIYRASQDAQAISGWVLDRSQRQRT